MSDEIHLAPACKINDQVSMTNIQARSTKPAPLLLQTVLALTAMLTNAAPVWAQVFQPGEILVNQYVASSIQRYSASGSLLQTYTGTGTYWEGASLTPDGNLVTAYNDGLGNRGINIFNPAGSQIRTIPINIYSFFGDISVFPNGTLAFNDQYAGLQFWTQTGAMLQTVSLPGLSQPLGSTMGSDGILYVTGLLSNNIARVNSSGGLLGLISLSFQPGDLVMNPLDNTFWITGFSNHRVEHVNTDGTVLSSFATGLSGNFEGIGLALDNNSLYVASNGSNMVKHFDLNGNLLGSFNVAGPSSMLFLTVVPAATPEPGSTMLVLTSLALLAAHHRRRE